MTNSNPVDTGALVSSLGAVISLSSIQPFISLLGSCIAIVAGLIAINNHFKNKK